MKKFACIICDKADELRVKSGELLLFALQDDGTSIIGHFPKAKLSKYERKDLIKLYTNYIKKALLSKKKETPSRVKDILVITADSAEEIIAEMIDVVSARSL